MIIKYPEREKRPRIFRFKGGQFMGLGRSSLFYIRKIDKKYRNIDKNDVILINKGF